MIRFVVPGDPVGKQRPQFARGIAYTPKKTKQYEEYVRLIWNENDFESFGNKPVIMIVDAYFNIPKSTTKRDRLLMIAGLILHTKKADADNCAKTIMDAINGLAYKDDAQVTYLVSRKHYSEKPRVIVQLEELEFDYEKESEFSDESM